MGRERALHVPARRGEGLWAAASLQWENGGSILLACSVCMRMGLGGDAGELWGGVHRGAEVRFWFGGVCTGRVLGRGGRTGQEK